MDENDIDSIRITNVAGPLDELQSPGKLMKHYVCSIRLKDGKNFRYDCISPAPPAKAMLLGIFAKYPHTWKIVD